MRLLFVLTLLTLTAVGIAAQAPTPELKVGDQAPDFTLQASRRQDLQALGLQGQASGRARVVSQGLHERMHD